MGMPTGQLPPEPLYNFANPENYRDRHRLIAAVFETDQLEFLIEMKVREELERRAKGEGG